MRIAQPSDGVGAWRFAFGPRDERRVIPCQAAIAERIFVVHGLAATNVQHYRLNRSLSGPGHRSPRVVVDRRQVPQHGLSLV
jgi:hypothetical protein